MESFGACFRIRSVRCADREDSSSEPHDQNDSNMDHGNDKISFRYRVGPLDRDEGCLKLELEDNPSPQ